MAHPNDNTAMFYVLNRALAQQNNAQAAHLLIVLGLALTAWACTPAFNWREVAFDGLPVVALLPCKPDRGERSVPLAGVPRQMLMAGCKAGEAMFTVAVVRLDDSGQVEQVKAELRAANKATKSEYFQHGNIVVQASVYGTPQGQSDGPGALSNQAMETFFSGIQLAGKP
jgi:hypothetical protein